MFWIRRLYKDIIEKKQEIGPIRDITAQKRKIPSIEKLKFQEAPFMNAEAFAIGPNGDIYIAQFDNPLTKITDITDETAKDEGINWDRDTYGRPVHMAVFKSGIVIASYYDSGTNVGIRIWHLDDINDTPTEVYTHENDALTLTSSFGFSVLDNGMSELVLMGEYGSDAVERNLVFSDDGGQTFTTVETSVIENAAHNSHWHDVEIDPYSGTLWASQGDRDNARIIYSKDLGDNWNQIPETLPFDTLRQPTTVTAFPERIIFGRDSDELNPGFDYIDRPKNDEEWDLSVDNIETLMEYSVHEQANNLYVRRLAKFGLEAYMTSGADTSVQPVHFFGTSDGGLSVHTVTWSIGGTADEIVRGCFGIDDTYIYGYGSGAGAGSSIIYAEKPEWI